MINLSPDDEITLTLIGSDLALILQGLGELPHKLAKGVEQRLTDEIIRDKTKEPACPKVPTA